LNVLVIPAREGSTRFPGKPRALIDGKPLLQRTWEVAQQVPELDAVYIATDTLLIETLAKSFGAQVLLTGKCNNGTERVREAIRQLPQTPRIIVNLQGDAPLTQPRMLSQLIQAMQKDPQMHLATIAMPYSEELQTSRGGTWVVMDRFQRALYFSKSPIPHLRQKTTRFRHIGVYAYTWEGLQQYCKLSPTPLEQAEQLEQLRALEHAMPIHLVLTETTPQWSVDTPEDLLIVEQLLKK